MNNKRIYPLSHPQKRIWNIEQIYPGTSMYNVGGTIRIQGPVDINILKKAIKVYLNNNPGTRIRIVTREGRPYQYISAIQDDNDINIHDFSNESDPENAFIKWRVKEARFPFDLISNQLYKICIFRITDNEAGYFLKFHHIICDGFSTYLMTSKVMEHYNKLINNIHKDSEDQYNYIDYLGKEDKYKKSDRFGRNKEFWNNLFFDLAEIPFTESSEDTRGNRKNFLVDEKLSYQIKLFCQENNISLNTFYTGILLIYLFKTNHSTTQVLGMPVMNRFGKKEKKTFGMYTSTMPLKYNIDESSLIYNFFIKLNKQFGLYYINQKYPYDLLVQDLKLSQYRNKPLFNVFVNYYNKKHVTKSNCFQLTNTDFYSGHQIYSLQLIIREWLDTHNISLSYDYKIKDYSEIEIKKLHGSLNGIIKQIFQNKRMAIKDIEILSPEEKYNLVYNYNSTIKDYPKNKTIHGLFEEQVLRTPEKTAISCENKGFTYKEINDKADQLAHYIKENKINKNKIIPITGSHSPELIIGILGILKADCAFLPIDPEIPIDRIRFILDEVNAQIIFAKNCPELGDNIIQDVYDLEDPEIYLKGYSSNADRQTPPKGIAYIIYTSGSTGNPKGVVIKHKSLVNYITWAKSQYIKNENEVFAFYSSIGFDLTITSIFTPLISGSQMRIYNPYEDDKDYVLYRILEEKKATIVKLTPSHLNLIKSRDNSTSSITRFIIGGEDLKAGLAEQVYESFNGNIELYNEYGPTESTVGCMIYKYNIEKDNRISVPIGKPINNCQVYILDKNLKPVIENAKGELYISGDCLAKGYYKNKLQTDVHFIENPFIPGKKMYKTGDVAKFINNNCIEYLGRNDNQIKIKGHRVELAEIEKKLLAFPEIGNVIVLLKQNNNTDYLCAYIIPNKKIGELQIKNRLLNILPHYMIPSFFIFLKSFPLTPNGKISKRNLPEPQFSNENFNIHYSTASGTESLLIHTIKEILNIERVLLTDNFFYLSGDSIKAIQISSKLRNYNYNLKVKDILSNPIIKEMATKITILSADKKIDQNFCNGEIQNTPIVVWFKKNIHKNQNYFNQSVLLELKVDIDKHGLKRIMSHIINHHDSLRINYNKMTERLYYNDKFKNMQIIISDYDISSFMELEKEKQLIRICEEIKSSFNIENTLLIACSVIRYSIDKTLLFITAHHLIIDGFSWRILFEDISSLIQQYQENKKFILADKTHSYQYWANYINTDTMKKKFESEIKFWNSIIKSSFHILNITPECRNKRTYKKFFLNTDMTCKLISRANIPYKTKPDELLIIAFSLGLSQYVNKNSVVLELENHGRTEDLNEVDVSRTIGWFTSMYPIKLKIINENLNSQIKSLKEQIRAIPNNGAGYGKLKYIAKKLPAEGNRFIRINFLGDFSNVDNKYFKISSLNHGVDIDNNNISALIEINLIIINKKLEISVIYNKYEIEGNIIDEIIRIYIDKIEYLVEYCVNKDEPEFTPSDFEAINLSQEELDNLFV